MTESDLRLHIENPAEWLRRSGYLDSIDSYLDLLQKENERINLVSRETSRDDLVRLAAESLVPFVAIAKANKSIENYLDIGSGGGFPAIPIALVRGPSTTTLVERRQKKSAALNRIGVQLDIPALNSIARTFEEIRFELKYDLITLRLVKLDQSMAKRICSLLTKGGHFVYYYSPASKLSTPNYSAISYCYTIVNTDQSKTFTIFTKK